MKENCLWNSKNHQNEPPTDREFKYVSADWTSGQNVWAYWKESDFNGNMLLIKGYL